MTVTFQWDSLSLKCMPASAIRRREEKGLDWTTMGRYPEEIERAEPRDTQDDVDAVIEELSAEHFWDHLGKQGQRIHQVLGKVKEYVFPLCDLKAGNQKSANYVLTDDYAVWFANR